jgi:hypothetical protein
VLRYIKAAFFSRAPIPALGQVPLNLLGVIGFSFLGLVEPSFWLLGTGLETLFLFSLATNSRFQNVVDAERLRAGEQDSEHKRRGLIASLPDDVRQRLGMLRAKCDRVAEINLNQQADEFTMAANRDALERLEWVYLKLLVARNNLLSTNMADAENTLRSQIATLEEELKKTGDSNALRQSRKATLNILKERLANIHLRSESLQEIDSDLMRIQAQVDLMIDNATMQAKPQTISTDIELATNLAGASLFGESEGVVADIDQALSAAPRNPAPRAPEQT